MTGTYQLDLTQEEIVKTRDLFDRPEILDVINGALRDQQMGIPPALGKMLRKAEKSGYFRVVGTSITNCTLCGATWGYYNHRRTNRRKGIHAGTPDHSSPIYRAGVTFETIFDQRVHFSIKGYQSGICSECWQQFKDNFFQGILDRQLPIAFEPYGEFVPQFEMQKTLTCFSCGAESPETEYGKLPAMMSGYYPGPVYS